MFRTRSPALKSHLPVSCAQVDDPISSLSSLSMLQPNQSFQFDLGNDAWSHGGPPRLSVSLPAQVVIYHEQYLTTFIGNYIHHLFVHHLGYLHQHHIYNQSSLVIVTVYHLLVSIPSCCACSHHFSHASFKLAHCCSVWVVKYYKSSWANNIIY